MSPRPFSKNNFRPLIVCCERSHQNRVREQSWGSPGSPAQDTAGAEAKQTSPQGSGCQGGTGRSLPGQRALQSGRHKTGCLPAAALPQKAKARASLGLGQGTQHKAPFAASFAGDLGGRGRKAPEKARDALCGGWGRPRRGGEGDPDRALGESSCRESYPFSSAASARGSLRRAPLSCGVASRQKWCC